MGRTATLQGRDGQSPTRRREDTMPCERDVARSNTRTAKPKTEVSVSPPGGGGGVNVENLRHPVYTLAPLPGKPDFRKSL